jgi:pimeloyl-ACP methyl ester carboxylesterase
VFVGLVVVGLLCTPGVSESPAATQGAADVLASFEKTTFTTPDGKRMNCHRRPGKGPALVLVPGTWGDIQRFTPLIEEMPSAIPLVVIELCWQGGHIPPTLELSMEQLADDVLWVIAKLKLKRFFVGGHSIGGMITVEIVGRAVPGLVGGIPLEGWTHHTVVKTAFGGEVVGKITPAQEVRRQAGRARGRGHLSEEQIQAIGTIWRRWNGFSCLERAQVPVLHVWGDRGKTRPNRDDLQLPDRPSIEIAWIAGASHLLVLESPKALAKVVAAFVRRHS